MRNITLFALLSVFCLILPMQSCKKDDTEKVDCHNFNFFEFVLEAEKDISSASVAYSMDNTPENCRAYKEALGKFIKVLEGAEKCIHPAVRDEWREDINDAKRERDELEC